MAELLRSLRCTLLHIGIDQSSHSWKICMLFIIHSWKNNLPVNCYADYFLVLYFKHPSLMALSYHILWGLKRFWSTMKCYRIIIYSLQEDEGWRWGDRTGGSWFSNVTQVKVSCGISCRISCSIKIGISSRISTGS